MILLSVLMSVHKEKNVSLEKAIESILGQSYEHLELIVVDDGMTNDNKELIKRYESDGRLKILINKNNLGLTKSLNKAASIATGKYIVRLDSDDWSDKNRLEKQLEFLESNPEFVVCGTGHVEFDPEGRSVPGTREVVTKDEELKSLLPIYNPFTHSSLMIRKKLFDEIGGYDESFYCAQDYDLIFRISKLGKLANIPQKLVGRTIGPDNISQKLNKLQVSNGLKVRFAAAKFYGFSIPFFWGALKSIIVILLPQSLTNGLRKLF